jgi:hypothetical protein
MTTADDDTAAPIQLARQERRLKTNPHAKPHAAPEEPNFSNPKKQLHCDGWLKENRAT